MGDDCSRDFLQRFVAESKHQLMERSEEKDEIELHLGLSLGGRFGVERKPTRLSRSSSSVTPQSTLKIENHEAIEYPLLRTTSLPTDSEEYRKRKELQCFKRKERTKKLMKKGGSREEQGVNALATAAAAPPGFRPPASQGSPGTGLSGICELESGSDQGLGFSATRSLAGVRSVAEPHGIASPIPSNSRATVSVKAEVTGMEGTKEMPCVSTKRIGPNGRRVQGFLYKYKRGLQEVKIVCVCHGRFLTPAEFVKHAGGGDVPFPLREIVVDTLSSSV